MNAITEEYIKSIMAEKIKYENGIYIYDNQICFNVTNGSDPLKFFFSNFPDEANEAMNNIFDELHPY